MNFSHIARKSVQITGSSKAFIAACVLIITWFIVSVVFFRFNAISQLFINTLTTIITFLMVFLIQHAGNDDTAALHKKLDELICAVDKADNDLIGIETKM